MKNNIQKRLVVCAALKIGDIVICGPRHGDCLNTAVQTLAIAPKGVQQLGFVDQDNKFMTREEAWIVADAAGQIRRPTGLERTYEKHRPAGVGDEGALFSENLY